MAETLQTKKISELPAANALGDADFLPIVQDGISRKSTPVQISLYVNGKLPVNVQALAGLAGAANQLAYFTGPGAMANTSLTPYARTILDDANAAAAQSTLGIPTLIADSARMFKMNVLDRPTSITLPVSGTGLCYQCSNAGITVTVPAGVTAGLTYSFRNNSLGTVTISAVAGQTIAGAPGTPAQTLVLQSGEWLEVQANNTSGQYFVTGRGYTGAGVPALTTARNIAITGDVVGNANFDGSANVSISVALGTSGVTPGTYSQVTVNSQGRVTGANTVVPLTYGGTGANTAASARTNLGLKGGAISDVTGTVSQTSGVPTGAIMERGSNANGEYVKYADGTMICWVPATASVSQVTASVAVSQNFTMPATFVGAFAVSVNLVVVQSNNNFSGYSRGYGLTTSVVQIVQCWSVVQTYSYSIMAIGRWF